MSSSTSRGGCDVPVAIIGMACRFPGEATNPCKFWELLKEGKDAFSEPDRFNASAFYHANSSGRQNVLPCKGAHFLKGDPYAFDAAFFNMTPGEALASDPRQRLALEVAYEALENASMTLQRVAGSRTACFVGAAANMAEYRDGIVRDFGNQPQHTIMGVSEELMSNRLSHFFDLHGPSATVETACSSSLVAVHLACQSLRLGESEMAVAGGVNLLLSPDTFMQLQNLSVLSPEGRSRSFDDEGRGYGRGEGCGIVVLKPLAAALRDGDPIRAVIRGTGSNSDGWTKGMAMPSGESQMHLIKDVYETFGLDYAETHTIGRAARNQRLIMGSVKPNIGHLEPAAGIAGLIKGVLALERGLIPPNIHLNKINRKIPLDEWNMEAPTRLTAWPVTQQRRMSISSFGLGGTNAHVVMEAHNAAAAVDDQDSRPKSSKRVFFLSSQDQGGFARIASSLLEHLDGLGPLAARPLYLADLAYTLATARAGLGWVSSFVAESLADVRDQLTAGVGREAVRRRSSGRKQPRLAFVFTGQGAQWAGMGIQLLSRPVFAASVAASTAYLARLGCEWEPVRELEKRGDESRLGRAEVSQAICTVLQIALVDELRSWGVRPARVIGHSSGEIAAAYCLGALSHSDAIAAAYFRGKASAAVAEASSKQATEMGMMAVGCSREQAQELIAGQNGCVDVTVACVNSPESITLSGHATELEKMAEVLQEHSIFHRRLKVEIAYHSPLMAAVSDKYLSYISHIEPREASDAMSMPAPIMVSSVTASEATPDMLGPYYWLANMMSPVLFSDGIVELVRPCKDGNHTREEVNTIDMMIEIGPHSTLAGPVDQTLSRHGLRDMEYHSVLLRGRDAVDTALDLARSLLHAGVEINAARANGDVGAKLLTDLPPYPWNHDRAFDATSRIHHEYLHRKMPRRGLLGAPMPSTDQAQRVWRGFIRLDEEPWLRGHKVGGTVLLPAAAMLSIAIEGGRQLAEPGRTLHAVRLRDVSFFAALALPESAATEVVLTMRPHLLGTAGHNSTTSWWELLISSSAGTGPLRDNCRGLLSLDYKEDRGEHMEREDGHIAAERLDGYRRVLDECGSDSYAEEDFYEHLAGLGFQYSGHFRSVQDIHPGDGCSTFGVRLSSLENDTFSAGQLQQDQLLSRPFLAHGATLDAIFQAWISSTLRDGHVQSQRPYAPTFVAEMEVSADFPEPKGQLLPGVCHSRRSGFKEWSVDTSLFDESRTVPCLSFTDFRLSELDDGTGGVAAVGSTAVPRSLMARVRWDDALDLMTPAEVMNAVSSRGLSTEAESLSTLVRLVLHGLNPGATTVELVRNAVEPRLLADLSVSDSGPRVLYASPDGEGAKDGEDGKAIDLSRVNSPQYTAYRDLLPAEVVVIPSWVNDMGAEELDEVLQRLLGLAAPEAAVVLATDIHGVTSTLESRGFTCSFATAGAPMLYRRRETPPPSQMQNGAPTNDVVVVEPAAASLTDPAVQRIIDTLLEDLSSNGKIVRHQWAAAGGQPTTTNEAVFAGKTVISLLELQQPFLESMTAADLQAVKAMMQKSARLLWVTRGDDPSLHVVDGLVRCVRSENPTADVRVLHLGSESESESDSDQVEKAPRQIARLATAELTSKDREFRAAQGRLQVARIVEDPEGDSLVAEHLADSKRLVTLSELDFPVKLAIGQPGLLDTFCFVKDAAVMTEPLGELDVQVQVHAASLNFKDVMAAMGMIALPALGSEASGIVIRAGSGVTNVQAGDRVAILCPLGTHKTLVNVKSSLATKLPDSLTFEEAVSVPVAYITAYHALVNVARLSAGQSVLVHAATGAVGQAAIQIALLRGLVVYATAGSPEKRAFLTERYGIAPSNIFHSRDASFAKAVARVTGKRGVDCVLNSLSGELLRASWDCVAPSGSLVELGLRDVVNNTRLDMKPFGKSISFSFFDVKDLPETTQAELLGTVFELVRSGRLTPVSPITTYPIDRVEEAYRTMQQGKHRGKIVLTFPAAARVPVLFPAKDSLTLDRKAAYLLVGGLGGLGRSLSQLLASCGARHLVFLSRSGADASPAARDQVEKLQAAGVQVHVLRGDVADDESFLAAMQQYERRADLPPIRGVVHLAAVLRDAVLDNMTHDDWAAALRPKVRGSRNLDRYFDHSRPLDFLVLCASVAGLWGNAGQAAYAAANTYQDALASSRRARGLSGVAVDLGIVRDVGMAAEQSFGARFDQWAKVVGIPRDVFLALMKSLIRGQKQQLLQQQSGGSSDWPPPQVCSGLGSAEMWATHDVVPPPAYHSDPRFSALTSGAARWGSRPQSAKGSDASRSSSSSSSSLASLLAGATTKPQAAEYVTEALVHKAAGILQIPPVEVDPSRPLYEYGVDSLVAIEVRNWINLAMNANIALLEIMGGESISQFAVKVAERSTLVSV
ncbi:putative PKS-like protein biosynthetic cluster [Pyricularia oryzae]|nr:putative PKS-like protein biosynthetic cluster [Pyricularia oryzae]